MTLVEFKSGQTFQAEWLRSLETVQRHMGLPVRRALVYGGDSDMARGETEILGWRSLARVVSRSRATRHLLRKLAAARGADKEG